MGLKGDEVLIPNVTFQATANAVKLTGAKPVLVDISPDNLLMDPKDLKNKINKHSKAVIPVHVSGRGSNIKNIEIAKEKKYHSLKMQLKHLCGVKINFMAYGELGCFPLHQIR